MITDLAGAPACLKHDLPGTPIEKHGRYGQQYVTEVEIIKPLVKGLFL